MRARVSSDCRRSNWRGRSNCCCRCCDSAALVRCGLRLDDASLNDFELHVIAPQAAVVLQHEANAQEVGGRGDPDLNAVALPGLTALDACIVHVVPEQD